MRVVYGVATDTVVRTIHRVGIDAAACRAIDARGEGTGCEGDRVLDPGAALPLRGPRCDHAQRHARRRIQADVLEVDVAQIGVSPETTDTQLRLELHALLVATPGVVR